MLLSMQIIAGLLLKAISCCIVKYITHLFKTFEQQMTPCPSKHELAGRHIQEGRVPLIGIKRYAIAFRCPPRLLLPDPFEGGVILWPWRLLS